MMALLALAFFSCAVAWFFFSLQAICNVIPGKGWIIWFPIWLFMPDIFTEEGNRYRVKALRMAGCMLLMLLAFLGIKSTL
ncbi:hypothetical protein [Wenzhouxiangella sp. XN201]|uniref:hypothetical protein n=1 Tax=Wenzhouxiangella sp. XN201 TaxID=2710755 RepID=UPI0013DD19BB|nr:hypothetical protein [Wenzhouxiangella sp. XN201]